MNMILISSAVLGTMGLVFGIGLAYASKKFAPKENLKVAQIEKELPGLNCGACGFAGCNPYAQALAEGKAEPNLCKPGGSKVEDILCKILGTESKGSEPMVAQRYCNGGEQNANKKFQYKGIKTCKAASLVNGGFNVCTYSCLGLGDCDKVCPVDAIRMDDNNLPQINKEICIGCEKCVTECPRNVLHMAPKKMRVHVRCSSREPAKNVVKACKVGCIACKKCENECPFDAIHVIENLAVINYEKCKNCTKCVQVCPRKIIEVELISPKKV